MQLREIEIVQYADPAKKSQGINARAVDIVNLSSFNIPSGVSEYYADQSAFCHGLVLRANEPFLITSMAKIETGRFKGSQVLILTPSPPFPFLKLPSELRNTVYKMLLGSDQPLRITGGRFGNFGKHGAAILGVNRQIHNEAGSILYGSNEFIFSSSTVAEEFFHAVSETRKLITKVNVETYFASSSINMFNALVKYPQIAEINLIGDINSSYDEKKLARTMFCHARQFLTAVANRKKAKLAGLDIISFRAATVFSRNHGWPPSARKYTQAEYEAFMGALRARAERQIKIKAE